MPSQYALPAAFDQGVEDKDKFNRLPFYLVDGEVREFPKVDDFNMLFGDIPWKPNMGDTMKQVTPQPSPVGEALFYPNLISEDPNKSVFENLESTESIQLRWHDYQSKMIGFLPEWQNFRPNLDFQHKDIIKQVANGHNTFVRTVMWDRSPYVYFAGSNLGSELVDAPTATGNAAQTAANSKTANWLAATIQAINGGNLATLSYKVLKNVATIALEDLDIPPFEGAKNVIAPNEMLKGKLLVYGSNEALIQLTEDPTIIARKTQNEDILFGEFKGPFCNGMVTWKSQRFALRCNANGVFIVPQLTEAGTNKTRKNPDYINADYEIAWLIGAGAYRTVKVGPPPKDFSTITKDKFWKMRWNGEVRITDQFLITRGTIGGGDFRQELNDDGRFLKFKATQVMHGILPSEIYNAFPIVYKRLRVKGE